MICRNSAQRLAGIRLVIVKQHRGQRLAHVPLNVIGQHAEEHVRTDAFLQMMMNGPDLEIHTFQAAKRTLDLG